MKTELVNTLLKAGIVSEAEVERAIHYESGTSIVERLLSLGYGSEDDVYKILQNKLRLAVVSTKDLANIPKDILNVVPKEVIEKQHILPFKVTDTTIHIAMFDPTQDSCINEICFFTSLRVLPYGALASDLAKALNKYYGLSLPESFKHGAENLDSKYTGPKLPPIKEMAAAPSTAGLPPLPSMSAKLGVKASPTVLPPLPTDFIMPEETAKIEPLTKVEVTPIPTPKVAATPKPGIPTKLPPLPQEKTGPVMQEIHEVDDLKAKLQKMQDDFDKLSKMVEQPESKPKARQEEKQIKEQIKNTQEEIAEVCTVNSQYKDVTQDMTTTVDYDEEAPEFKDISAAFPQTTRASSPDDVNVSNIENAKSKEAVLTHVLAEIKKLCSRCIVLFVKYDDLVPVIGTGKGIENNLKDFTISLKTASVFKTVYDSKKEFYGPVSDSTGLDSFFKHFGNERPMSVTIIPCLLDGEIFAMIYTEEAPTINEMRQIADAMSRAFDKLLA